MGTKRFAWEKRERMRHGSSSGEMREKFARNAIHPWVSVMGNFLIILKSKSGYRRGGNTSSRTITEVKKHWTRCSSVAANPGSQLDWISYPSYTGCCLCVDAELTIGQHRLGVHVACGLNNPWHHLRTCHNWFGILNRPPYVTTRGSAGWNKKSKSGQAYGVIFLPDAMQYIYITQAVRECVCT